MLYYRYFANNFYLFIYLVEFFYYYNLWNVLNYATLLYWFLIFSINKHWCNDRGLLLYLFILYKWSKIAIDTLKCLCNTWENLIYFSLFYVENLFFILFHLLPIYFFPSLIYIFFLPFRRDRPTVFQFTNKLNIKKCWNE